MKKKVKQKAGTKFSDFMKEVEEEAVAEGPEAVEHLESLRAYHRIGRAEFIDERAILLWCNSMEKQFSPREIVPHGEEPRSINEQFLATGIRYLRALCGKKPLWCHAHEHSVPCPDCS